MARKKSITIAALNITMQPPHSPQIYYDLFKEAFQKKLQGHIIGDKFGHIGSLFNIELNKPLDGIYGIIYKYTEIDKEGWFNTEKMEKPNEFELEKISIPPYLKPNTQQFYFSFFPKEHRFIYISYESNQSFSPRLMQKFLCNILNHEELIEFNDVEVIVEQSRDQLRKILKFFKLDRIFIEINLPNADSDRSDEDEVFKRMEAENVGKWSILKKSKKFSSIDPDEDTEKLARVAISNGYVEANGEDELGNKIHESTKDHPLTQNFKYDPQKERLSERFTTIAVTFLKSLFK